MTNVNIGSTSVSASVQFPHPPSGNSNIMFAVWCPAWNTFEFPSIWPRCRLLHSTSLGLLSARVHFLRSTRHHLGFGPGLYQVFTQVTSLEQTYEPSHKNEAVHQKGECHSPEWPLSFRSHGLAEKKAEHAIPTMSQCAQLGAKLWVSRNWLLIWFIYLWLYTCILYPLVLTTLVPMTMTHYSSLLLLVFCLLTSMNRCRLSSYQINHIISVHINVNITQLSQ